MVIKETEDLCRELRKGQQISIYAFFVPVNDLIVAATQKNFFCTCVAFAPQSLLPLLNAKPPRRRLSLEV